MRAAARTSRPGGLLPFPYSPSLAASNPPNDLIEDIDVNRRGVRQ